ncbi:NAD(P)/FAD-dependent oxidoreductase [Histidinibacterium aquaticum]|uniref:FAD-binding oxidoreductase n=1 Tax=Histidinibacterium aquaticum TaxID=2613962 RepID=A0A5J5GS74_9RHOB|nr:FAD-binding oxidoreductase [Histidinibacterium aquaticum]KAA9010438.1 FAD-binding oxidoreductase [Histidinibacterium aquaticum]
MRDFVIVGGGIAGISAAARLSHLGTVTVLEQEDSLAHHASGRSAALFEQNYGKVSTIALNEAGADYHATANGGVLSPRGIMLIGTDETAELFEHDRKQMKLEEVGYDEARRLWPILAPHVTRAAWDPRASDIDTDLLIQNFGREARGNGAEIRTKSAVTAIRRTGTGWEVEAGGEVIEARRLVNAAGAWVDVVARLAGLSPLGVTPLRRSMARIPAPEGHDPSGWPMVFGPGEDWYAKPDAGALIVSPADEDPAEPHDAWADDMVLAEGLARFEEHMTVEVTRMLANWAGLRTFSPDRELVIGPDPAEPDFLWFACQGGYGFQTAPAGSQLLADLAGGRSPDLPPDIVKRLDPARFERVPA